eukprot:gene22970-biopygen20789
MAAPQAPPKEQMTTMQFFCSPFLARLGNKCRLVAAVPPKTEQLRRQSAFFFCKKMKFRGLGDMWVICGWRPCDTARAKSPPGGPCAPCGSCSSCKGHQPQDRGEGGFIYLITQFISPALGSQDKPAPRPRHAHATPAPPKPKNASRAMPAPGPHQCPVTPGDPVVGITQGKIGEWMVYRGQMWKMEKMRRRRRRTGENEKMKESQRRRRRSTGNVISGRQGHMDCMACKGRKGRKSCKEPIGAGGPGGGRPRLKSASKKSWIRTQLFRWHKQRWSIRAPEPGLGPHPLTWSQASFPDF